MAKEYLPRAIFSPGDQAEGEFLAIEDFEVCHYFVTTGTATKYFCYRSPTASKSGNFGMVVGYGGAAVIGDYVSFWYPYAIEPTSGLGAEMVFNLYYQAGDFNLDFILYFPDIYDRMGCVVQVRINTATLAVSVSDEAGNLNVIGTLDQKMVTRWQMLYLELDKTTNKYKTLIIGGQSFAVSGLRYQKTGAVDIQNFFKVTVTSLTADNNEVWINHVLIRAMP